MIVEDCALCIHRRAEKKDGWIPTCDAFPDGKPENWDYGSVRGLPECDNGIGFEPNELCKRIGAAHEATRSGSESGEK